MADQKRRPRTLRAPPATVHVSQQLLDTIRAQYPVTRDWTDAQVTAGCLAMVLRLPRLGTVHTD